MEFGDLVSIVNLETKKNLEILFVKTTIFGAKNSMWKVESTSIILKLFVPVLPNHVLLKQIPAI